jgi:hypothetical protein
VRTENVDVCIRVEAAYSPDAASENPGFPIGIYVSDGLMF